MVKYLITLFTESHRITECSGLEGTSMGHLVQPPCQSRDSYSRLHRTASRRVLNISREGDSTTSLGTLFQCSGTLRGRNSSSCSDGTSYASVCAHCPLSCHWALLKRAWPHPPDTHPSDICKYILGHLAAFSSSGWTSPAPSAFPCRRDAPVL